jgi:hypothetical protein
VGAPPEARLAQAQRQRDDQQHQQRQRQQRVLPAQAGDQETLDRHHEELPERTCRRRHPHGPGTLLGRDLAPQHAVDHRIGGARLRRADEQAGGQGEQQRGGRQCHAHQAQAVENGADDEHAEGAEAVGRHAREHTHQAPGNVLDGNGQRERLARPAHGLGDGLQPQAEAVAYAHGQGHDGGTAGQHLEHGKLGRAQGHSRNVTGCGVLCRYSLRRYSTVQ